MKPEQPAWALRAKDEDSNVRAVRALLERSAPKPTRIVEFFGGIGGVTRMVQSLYPDAEIHSWDADERCFQELASIPGIIAHKGDSLANAQVEEGDGVLMDFNLWTLLRAEGEYKDVMSRVFNARPLWVQVADSALGKLHLNYASYGMAKGELAEYLDRLDVWAKFEGYRLSDFQRSHSRTVMVLFEGVK